MGKKYNFTTTKRYSNLNNVGGSFMGTAYLGGKWANGVALGAFFAAETEVGGSSGLGVTKNSTYGKNGEKVETMSSNISIVTSGTNGSGTGNKGSNEVGSKADILFGHSQNYTFGVAKNLTLIKQDLCNVICKNSHLITMIQYGVALEAVLIA